MAATYLIEAFHGRSTPCRGPRAAPAGTKGVEPLLHDTDVPLEDRYRLFIDAAQEYAIFMLIPSGHVASWNRGAERIKGYRPDEIIGRHFSTFCTPEDIAAGKPEGELPVATEQLEQVIGNDAYRAARDGDRIQPVMV